MSAGALFLPGFWLRALLWSAALGAPMRTTAALREVMVCSFVTAAGQGIAAPTTVHPAACLLVDTGAREIGPVASETGTVDAATSRALIEHALRVNAYQVRGQDERAGDLIIVCHWGCAAPMVVNGSRPTGELLNLSAMLAVIGEQAWKHAVGFQRDAMLAAVREERYFVIVSAYHARAAQTLLWRTHMTVPSVGLTQRRALPVLLAAGAALFGRETPQPRRIAIEVTGVLNPEGALH